ncbi:MAG: hypothetical protein OXU63_07820 [Acidobacteriota bacterium]|nr:hypothetical protein [Acidobacteriota bacterium]
MPALGVAGREEGAPGLGGANLFEPEDAVVAAAVAARRDQVVVSVLVNVEDDELVEHAAHAAGNVVPGPQGGRVAGVLEPSQAAGHAGGGLVLAVAVARPRVHWHGDGGQNRLRPARVDQRIPFDLEQGDLFEREGVGHRLAFRLLRALVRRDRFEPAVLIEIGQVDADPGSPPRRHGGNQPRPITLPNALARVLEVDQVVQLARHENVEQAVAVHVADCDVLGSRRLLAVREVDAGPAARIAAAEVDRPGTDSLVAAEPSSGAINRTSRP